MSEPVIRVRGEASAQCSPDLATLTVTLHRTGASAEVVRSDLATAAVEVSALLGPVRPALESSSTGGLHVAPVHDGATGARVTGYRGSYALTLVVGEVDALSPLVVAVASVPGVQVDGPWWSLRPGNPAYRQVRLDAITDARREPRTTRRPSGPPWWTCWRSPTRRLAVPSAPPARR